jgi:hypothetical protein
MKYFARGLRDMLKTTQLNIEFFHALDPFQINFIEMCFQQSYDEKMGMLGEIEYYNYHVYQDFKNLVFEQTYGLDQDYWKKVA